MLFLINSLVLDVQTATADLAQAAARKGQMTPTLYQAVVRGQQLFFRLGAFEEADSAEIVEIAALIALSSEANAALFVRATNATTYSDVAVRLANISLVTILELRQLQDRKRLTADAVNRGVWDHVAASKDH